MDIKLGGVPFDKEKHDEVKALGGLYVIGTERHDARRIDNQLRGRSGRQGDPGETQFYVSMDDSLMRIFAPDSMRNIMAKLKLPEDQPIQNSLITRSLENAQTKIEGFNFDARKHLLEFDSVLNTQRTAVYERRRRILLGEKEIIKVEIQQILERGGEEIEKVMKNKEDVLGKDEWNNVLRRVLLQSIDTFWVDHLETMEYTRSSVNLRAYGQRDPLIEYKKEALRLFKEMGEGIYSQIIHILPNIGEGAFQKEEQKLKENLKKAKIISGDKDFSPQTAKGPGKETPKVGRNEKVVIVRDGEEKEIKYKKAEALLNEGWKIKE